MTIRPAGASPKKSGEDDEWDFSHLAPDYTWKKFKEAIGWGADQRLAFFQFLLGGVIEWRGRFLLHHLRFSYSHPEKCQRDHCDWDDSLCAQGFLLGWKHRYTRLRIRFSSEQ
jgi:hypothetical protein